MDFPLEKIMRLAAINIQLRKVVFLFHVLNDLLLRRLLALVLMMLQFFHDEPNQLHPYDRASETLFSVSLLLIVIP